MDQPRLTPGPLDTSRHSGMKEREAACTDLRAAHRRTKRRKETKTLDPSNLRQTGKRQQVVCARQLRGTGGTGKIRHPGQGGPEGSGLLHHRSQGRAAGFFFQKVCPGGVKIAGPVRGPVEALLDRTRLALSDAGMLKIG